MPEAIMFRKPDGPASMRTEIMLWGEREGAASLWMFCDPSTASAVAAETNVALTVGAEFPEGETAAVKSDGGAPVASDELAVRVGRGIDHGLWREPPQGEPTFVARLQGSRDLVEAMLEVLPLRAVDADA